MKAILVYMMYWKECSRSTRLARSSTRHWRLDMQASSGERISRMIIERYRDTITPYLEAMLPFKLLAMGARIEWEDDEQDDLRQNR
jgi:hypothetical protein